MKASTSNSVGVSGSRCSPWFRRQEAIRASRSICRSPTLDATEHGADALDHLGRVERLDDIVIRADPQGRQLGHLIVQRGDHDDRGVEASPDRGQNLDAVSTGQADVEQHQVGPDLGVIAKRVLHVGGAGDLIAGSPDIGGQEIGDLRLVFDNENTIAHAAAFRRPYRRPPWRKDGGSLPSFLHDPPIAAPSLVLMTCVTPAPQSVDTYGWPSDDRTD
jgi:hypothetical protein